MNNSRFLSDEEIALYYDLVNKELEGKTSAIESNAFNNLSRKKTEIENIYVALYEKSQRTAEEDEILTKCYNNIVNIVGYNIRRMSDDELNRKYSFFKNNPSLPLLGRVMLSVMNSEVNKRKANKTSNMNMAPASEFVQKAEPVMNMAPANPSSNSSNGDVLPAQELTQAETYQQQIARLEEMKQNIENFQSNGISR